ncbi:MAG: cytochrome b/b6 domain-containing protein [Magnetococcales bacterium]|nr:cytochrome b/b6 domain-containing protein [Magnetococcales bacterium]
MGPSLNQSTPSEHPPRTIRIWDLPTRIFHWLLAVLFAVAWISGEMELAWLHVRSGEAMLGLLLFRIAWGFVGGDTALFHNFVRGPQKIRRYLHALATGETKGTLHVGHNPAGGAMVMALITGCLLAVGLGLFSQEDDDPLFTGALAHLLPQNYAELVAEIHEGWFGIVAALVALHVAVNLFYLLVLDNNLIRPMISGSIIVKDSTLQEPRMGKTWKALLVAALIGAGLYAGLNSL